MSHKTEQLRKDYGHRGTGGFDFRYIGYFECFNGGRYFEAHEVLEDLWLGVRGQTNDKFYKALIQLAGAFVHVQKNRVGPAAALFKLAAQNLRAYPASYEGLELSRLVAICEEWIQRLTPSNGSLSPDTGPPVLSLPVS